jgi:hypothetical protein
LGRHWLIEQRQEKASFGVNADRANATPAALATACERRHKSDRASDRVDKPSPHPLVLFSPLDRPANEHQKAGQKASDSYIAASLPGNLRRDSVRAGAPS